MTFVHRGFAVRIEPRKNRKRGLRVLIFSMATNCDIAATLAAHNELRAKVNASTYILS